VRASPCSLELLQDIRDFVPLKSNEFEFPVADACRPKHYHEVLQWLKVRIQGSNHSRLIGISVQAFPNPPQDVIEIWQNHLMAACDDMGWHWIANYSDYEWREWQNGLKQKRLFLPNQP
jgi:hypothetical protein